MPRKKKKKRISKVGLPPGTIIHVGERKVESTGIEYTSYDAQNLSEKSLNSMEHMLSVIDKERITWINITGLHDTVFFEKIKHSFNIHPLVMEDVLNTEQRTKVEIHDDYMFVVLKMITFNRKLLIINKEQVSFILSKNLLLTFQEQPGDLFDPIRVRIRDNKGRIRKSGPDYLLYCLMDVLTDHYFSVLEELGEQVENLEEKIYDNPHSSVVKQLHHLKRQFITLHKAVWPMRELIGAILKEEGNIISKATFPFFKDIADHIIQVMDAVYNYREIVSGLMDLYLSMVSIRMNEVMKVLTIIATIFIPLSFIAGIYGMNFEFMPELKWRWGYFIWWAVTISVTGLMLIFFRKKKWF
ncbi:MAG: magnesium/cobalt transporter CorA [Calditrichaeota bacterium]|nr:MAG: magnesium/cobalt transporter CorA [Calditrichota bacterium]